MPVSSFTGVQAICERSLGAAAPSVAFSGTSAEVVDWQAGTQQSILPLIGFGMSLPIVHPAMLSGGAAAAFAATGANARPRAQRTQISNRITRTRIKDEVTVSIFSDDKS